MTDIQCVFESMSGTGSIYISNFTAAQNIQLLQDKGIKAIVSVARSGLLHHTKQDIPYYLYLPAQDQQDYEIYKFFNQTFDFIDETRKKTNILVHCMAGVSRSVTIVIAYLLKKFKSSLRQVIKMIQRKRNKINPNKGFIQQLKKYAAQEGLQCNFNFQEIPIKRNKSHSKQKLSYSMDRYKINKKDSYLINSPIKQEKKNDKTEVIQFKRQIMNQNLQQSYKKQPQESKKQKYFQILKTNETLNSNKLDLQPKKIIKNNEKSPLLREKKLSIEQKIIKVRQKILKKDNKANSNDKQQKKKETQNNLIKSIFDNKNIPSKRYSQYFNFYSKRYQKNINLNKIKQKSIDEIKIQNISKEKIQINFCQTQNPIFHMKQFKLPTRNIYSKIQHHTTYLKLIK